MHRYLPGILLAQIVTLVLFWVNLAVDSPARWVNVVLPAGLITVLTAFWFASIARADAERFASRLRAEHARDREKLQLDAERSQAEIREQAQHAITREHRRIGRRANAKVGLAFAGAAAAGLVLLITEMMMLGMLTISTTGGAIGGYILRLRQQRRADSAGSQAHGTPTVVNAVEPANNRPSPDRGQGGQPAGREDEPHVTLPSPRLHQTS